MTTYGIKRPIDRLGRIVLPAEIRKDFNLKVNDQVEVFTKDNFIMMRKAKNNCVFCNSSDLLREFEKNYICSICINDIKKSL